MHCEYDYCENTPDAPTDKVCGVCDKYFCDECLYECSRCGRIVCCDCGRACGCGADYIACPDPECRKGCPDCQGTGNQQILCAICGKGINCEDERHGCHECGNMVCAGCSCDCIKCGEEYCMECLDVCETCAGRLCRDDKNFCDRCGSVTCASHLSDRDGNEYCPDCECELGKDVT